MDDLISRQEAIESLVEKGQCSTRYRIGEIWELNGSEIREVIESLPSKQSEQKKGEWVLWFNNQYLEKYYYCSKCGSRKYEEHKPLDYFCSNCGADMRGEKDE